MLSNDDPFDIVRKWWNNSGQLVISDCVNENVDPSKLVGAFECLLVGILFSINDDSPHFVKNTLNALRKCGLTDPRTLAKIHLDTSEYRNMLVAKKKCGVKLSRIEYLAATNASSADFHQFRSIWKQHYLKGRLPDKIYSIVRDAKIVLDDPVLKGDFRRVHSKFTGDGRQIIDWMWNILHGIKIKTFLVTREMQMNSIWNVDGKYCCVPDIQVGSSLKRWNKIPEWPAYGIDAHIDCSEIIWGYYRELYDFPILHYARAFGCNGRESQKRCNLCEIVNCKDKHGSTGSNGQFITTITTTNGGTNQSIPTPIISLASVSYSPGKGTRIEAIIVWPQKRRLKTANPWPHTEVHINSSEADKVPLFKPLRTARTREKIPIKLMIGATQYDGTALYYGDKDGHGYISSTVILGRQNKCLKTVLPAAGFTKGSVNLEFSGNHVTIFQDNS